MYHRSQQQQQKNEMTATKNSTVRSYAMRPLNILLLVDNADTQR